jgi:DNA replication and repair protein RecF
LREALGVEPVLLADDVLGELDARRRDCFWAWVGRRERQVVATGTSLPEGVGWEVFRVEAGRVCAA